MNYGHDGSVEARGTNTVNVEPIPGWLATTRSPPIVGYVLTPKASQEYEEHPSIGKTPAAQEPRSKTPNCYRLSSLGSRDEKTKAKSESFPGLRVDVRPCSINGHGFWRHHT